MNFTHLIVTDNEFMDSVGLSAFTTGDLYSWVIANDGSNLNYIDLDQSILNNLHKDLDNLSIEEIDKGDASAAWPIMDILIGKNVTAGQYNYTNYRKNERNSINVDFTDITTTDSNWSYSIGDAIYTSSDLELDNDDLSSAGYQDSGVSILINMNELVIDPTYLDDATNKEKSRTYFIRDIKVNASGCVCWSAPSDSIKSFDDEDNTVSQDVSYKLYLYDNCCKKQKQNTVALPSLTVADYKCDAFGNRYVGYDSEGRRNPVQDDQPKSKVGGKIETTWNQYTGSFEAGTTQVIAVMETDLEAATFPDTGAVSTPDDYDSPTKGFGPTLGVARPLTMKNGNPLNWGPEWKYSSGGDDTEKTKVMSIPVQNKLNIAFASGDAVVLNRIDGVWQPIGVQGTTSTPTVATKVTKWDFMYMVSNAKNYFISSDETSYIRYDSYEEAFYNMYYNNDESDKELDHNINGFVQITSFDFMGASVGGLRNNHALGNTLWDKDVNGNAIDNPADRPSINTAPFFGCVFPDGYSTSKISLYKSEVADPMVTNNNWSDYMRGEIGNNSIIFDQTLDANNLNDLFGSTDSKLSNLPADIALNSDVDSEIGAPLSILKKIEQAFSTKGTSLDVQSRVTDFLKEDDDRYAYYINSNDQEPVFEFQPSNSRKVQFRSLKAEVYATFEIQGTDPLITDVDTRGVFGSEAWRTVSDSKSPIANNVLNRSNYQPGEGGVIGTLNGLGDQIGFQYNTDIADAVGLPGTNSAYPPNYWSFDWQINGDRPAGAVGIIGATCKVTANSSITFNAQCNYGMRTSVIPDDVFGAVHYSTFGGRDSTYYSFNNTTLNVRIYQGWPKRQTVYDPRYFAVHHFSAGAGDTVTTNKYYINNVEKTVTEYVGDTATDIGYKDGKHVVDQITYSDADFKVPTLIGSSTTEETGFLPAVNTPVYNNEDVDPEWRDVADWQINKDARGKLLPTQGFTRLSIGVALNSQIVVTDGGSEFQDGDTFTTTGDTGSGVLLSAVTTDGAITSFTIVDEGSGFDHTDFFKQSDVQQYNSAAVKLTPVTIQGDGDDLLAYVAFGLVNSISTVINGPSLATNEPDFTLSIDPPLPDDDNPAPVPEINASKPTVVSIANISSNNEYDVFLHYHNDISHCFITEWGFQGNFFTGPQSREQAITLEISPV